MKPFQRKDRDGWWVRFKDADGKWWTRLGGATEGEAYVTLSRYEREAMAIREGWVDRRQVESAKASHKPIGEVIAAYRAYQVGKRNSPAHVDESVRVIEKIADGIGARCLADIDYGKVEVWLADLLESGRSARTRNVFLLRINALLNWAVRRRMLIANPLLGMESVSEQCDKREVSRALSPDEVDKLLSLTPCTERQLFYRVAVRTGLRWSEIERLEWSCVDLDGGWLTPQASETKSRRSDPLPISPDLLDALKAFDSERVGRMFKYAPTLRTFKRDIKRVGIDYDTERGQADRKCLRKTFGTHLAMG
ncbi:tyrosine-type recombinase/integrase [Planctomycetales bacterium ZRK34]|nr:tyrosine-type recombinase/integrase [Planctomycetales bacterium ZRK34]